MFLTYFWFQPVWDCWKDEHLNYVAIILPSLELACPTLYFPSLFVCARSMCPCYTWINLISISQRPVTPNLMLPIPKRSVPHLILTVLFCLRFGSIVVCTLTLNTITDLNARKPHTSFQYQRPWLKQADKGTPVVSSPEFAIWQRAENGLRPLMDQRVTAWMMVALIVLYLNAGLTRG